MPKKKKHGSTYISRDRNKSYIRDLERAADTRSKRERDIDSIFEDDGDTEVEEESFWDSIFK